MIDYTSFEEVIGLQIRQDGKNTESLLINQPIVCECRLVKKKKVRTLVTHKLDRKAKLLQWELLKEAAIETPSFL